MRRVYSTEKRRQASLVAQKLLTQAGLTQGPFSIEELIARSDRYLGCRILLIPFSCPPKGDGAVFAANGRYVICYRANTDELHQLHIIMHELAHVVLGHRTPLEDGWLVFLPEKEMAADMLADELISRSLGVEKERRLWFSDFVVKRLGNLAVEQDRLRSLFE